MKPISVLLWLSLILACESAFSRTLPDSSLCVTSSKLLKMDDNLVASIEIEISRHIRPNESVKLILRLDDGEGHHAEFPPIYMNGRNQHLAFLREARKHKEEYVILKRDNRHKQTIHYLRAIPFAMWMKQAVLSLTEEACGCGVYRRKGTTQLARLHELPQREPILAFVTPQMEKRKIREESGSAFLDFPLNKTEIYPDYRNNSVELDKIKKSIDLIQNDSNVTITRIIIHGYASPEGPFNKNDRLARERTHTLKNHVMQIYALQDSLFSIGHTAEDWNGFIHLLQTDTTLVDRDALLRIAESRLSPDRKEEKMRKRYPKSFAFILEQWFAGLRHSDYTIRYTVRPFTIEQAKEVYRTNPKNLSIDEMFRIAQTYSPESEEYKDLFMTAVQLNPNDPVANLNAACIALARRDADSAEPYLEKAFDCAEKILATGVWYMLKGEYKEAEAWLLEAEDEGLKEATENLKQIRELY